MNYTLQLCCDEAMDDKIA